MAIIYGRDPDGRATVAVPLSNDPRSATLYVDDHTRVIAALGPAKWFVNSNGWGNVHVRARLPRGGNVMVARLVMDAGPGVLMVRPRDRDPFNLRSSNLDTVRRGSASTKILAAMLASRSTRRERP